MKKVLKTVSFVLFLLILSPSVQSAPPQTPFHFTEAFKLAVKLRQEADDKLFDNMEAIAEWLEYYKQKHGRFPEVGTDQDQAEQFFRRYLKNNPYSATAVQKREETLPCKVRFEYNSQLNNQLIQQWLTTPPSTWKAEPGTIVVIINTENEIVIWGCGADHLPIMDFKNNKVRLVIRDFSLELHSNNQPDRAGNVIPVD